MLFADFGLARHLEAPEGAGSGSQRKVERAS